MKEIKTPLRFRPHLEIIFFNFPLPILRVFVVVVLLVSVPIWRLFFLTLSLKP